MGKFDKINMVKPLFTGNEFVKRINADICAHLQQLGNHWTILQLHDKHDRDYKEKAKFQPWFGKLIIYDEHNQLKSDLVYLSIISPAFLEHNPTFFPVGTDYLFDIMWELDLLLPKTSIIKEALPVLVTAYILKYRDGMHDSTLSTINNLITRKRFRDTAGIIKRFTLERWESKFKDGCPQIKDIAINNSAVIRTYYNCLIFSSLLVTLARNIHIDPYQSVYLFNYLGGYAELFLTPAEFQKLNLNNKTMVNSLKLSINTSLIFQHHLAAATTPYTIGEGIEKDSHDVGYKLEIDQFCLKMKLVLYQRRVISEKSSNLERNKLKLLFQASLTDVEQQYLVNWTERGYLRYYHFHGQ